MGSTKSREIRRELDELKPSLEAYVAQAIGAAKLERLLASSDGPARKADVQKLIRVMLDQWDAVFRSRLRSIVRTYLHEVLDIRNRWAHEEPFSHDDVERAKSTIRLLAEAIEPPPRTRAPNESSPKPGPTRASAVKASYRATRLLFKAAVIEALEPSDRFEIVTPDGTFEMSKADFYRVFPNVVKTRSYREAGVYHYPTVPRAALAFLRR